MSPEEEIILWKAPQAGRPAEEEVTEGFDPKRYPGNGPYFAVKEELAKEFRKLYRNGLQEIRVSRALFLELVQRGIVSEDPQYPDPISYHVPAKGLHEFNAAIKAGTRNAYKHEAMFADAEEEYDG
jgi:hypothetical protein